MINLYKSLIWNICYCFVIVVSYVYEPMFLNDFSNIVLSENTAIGTNIYNLSISNPNNKSFKFDLIGTDQFAVNSTTGSIILSKHLDREKNDQLNFSVTLEYNDDISSRKVLIKQDVTVIISDENDNKPIFENTIANNSIFIKENMALHSIILENVIVIDLDQRGDDLEVECVNFNHSKSSRESCLFFSIEPVFTNHSYFIGNIQLRHQLDFRFHKYFEMILRAFDGDLETFHTIQIHVVDIQNQPPQFIGSLTAVINEDVFIHTLVMKLKAIDVDTENPRLIKYQLLKNPNEYFSLGEVSGELRTAKLLNREEFQNSSATVIVVVKAFEVIDNGNFNDNNNGEGNNTSTVTDLKITINDINDEVPTFNQDVYSIEIDENISNDSIVPNLKMFVSDLDLANNSVFLLNIDDITNTFSIEPEDLIIGSSFVNLRVNNSFLDYENPNQRKFIILIKAFEVYTKEKFTSTATIIVNLLDVNDNVPYFNQDLYEISVDENTAVNKSIGQIMASDLDGNDYGNNSLVYELFGYGAEHFHLNQTSGEIFVSQCHHKDDLQISCLDFEQYPTYFLTYKVTDNYGFGFHSLTSLNIILNDINDNRPECLHNISTAIIDEDSTFFDHEIRLETHDFDRDSEIRYSLEKNDLSDYFWIDNLSGILRVNESKPLEQIHKRNFELTAIVSDGLYSSKCRIRITMRDINNNAPKFEQKNYNITIREDIEIGRSILIVRAIDEDDGENALLKYRIKKGAFHSFRIDEHSGEIQTIQQLDYDNRSSYHLEIVASDSGKISLSGFATVHIYIENTNNKSPYFQPKIQRVQVREDSKIGTIIYQLIVHDPDLNGNYNLSYSNYFAQNQFKLENTSLHFDIDMSTPIKGIDKDGNEIVSNYLNNFTDWFRLNQSTGEVLVNQKLNRNIVSIIELIVFVRNLNGSNKNSNGTLLIQITNVNTYVPVFKFFQQSLQNRYSLENLLDSIFHININEEELIGTQIGCFQADDKDSPIQSYNITFQNQNQNYVSIDHQTGCISIEKRLDYETIQSFSFEIQAFDNGSPQLSSNLTIIVNLTNINDMIPVFEKPFYNISLEENPNENQVLIQIVAHDQDIGLFGLVNYSLSGHFAQHFAINASTGNLSVKNVTFFDRESIENVTIYVVCSDQAAEPFRLSAIVPVYVYILDVNDNSPIFTKSMYEVEITKSLLYNTRILGQGFNDTDTDTDTDYLIPLTQVHAIDYDQGIYSKIHYKIIDGNVKNMFYLNDSSGFLYFNKSILMKDMPHKSIKLTIEGRDYTSFGLGSNFNQTYVLVSIYRKNMFQPEFQNPSKSESMISIIENMPINSFVINITAIDLDDNDNDPDMLDNAKISYYFQVRNQNVNETNEFQINEITGEIRTRKLLDREERCQYELLLVAKDHGIPISYETIRLLIIKINDLNDNKPRFLVNSYSFSLEENLSENLKIGQVFAIDDDNLNDQQCDSNQTPNHIYYFIKSGNENNEFFIDKSNGILYSNRSFDREKQSDYHLRIICSNDLKFHENESSNYNFNQVQVHIVIQDVNDNSPVFQPNTYFVGVQFNTPINEHILQIEATDHDLGANGTIHYFIKTSNFFKFSANRSSGSIIPSPFKIDQNGVISVANFLTEYNQGRFILEVVAQEIANHTHQSVAEIYIWIYELSQSIRIVFSKTNKQIVFHKNLISNQLSNITQNQFVIGKIQNFIDSSGTVHDYWSEMHVHAVNKSSMSIVPVDVIMKSLDTNYDRLKNHYRNYSIQNIIPAELKESDQQNEIASIAILFILSILIIGGVVFVIICLYLKKRLLTNLITNNEKKQQQQFGLMKQSVFHQLNTTENPLWIEQKLKLYEEQELTMQVFNDNEFSMISEPKNSMTDNAYATLEQRSSNHDQNATPKLFLDSNEVNYVNISNDNSNNDILLAFNGSTFQAPQNFDKHTDN